MGQRGWGGDGRPGRCRWRVGGPLETRRCRPPASAQVPRPGPLTPAPLPAKPHPAQLEAEDIGYDEHDIHHATPTVVESRLKQVHAGPSRVPERWSQCSLGMPASESCLPACLPAWSAALDAHHLCTRHAAPRCIGCTSSPCSSSPGAQPCVPPVTTAHSSSP